MCRIVSTSAPRPLTLKRQLYKDCQSQFNYWLDLKKQFEHQHFFSKSRWQKLGYKLTVPRNFVSITFKSPRGSKTYKAYHVSCVELSNHRWSMLLRLIGINADELVPTVSNRRLVRQRLIASDHMEYGEELAFSLKSPLKIQEELLHHEWLSSKFQLAEAELIAAKQDYYSLLEPILAKRKEQVERKPLVAKLTGLGADLEENASPDELKHGLTERRRRLQKEQDDRLQQQYAKAIHRLQECGIDLSTIPPNVPHQAVVILALNGFLATVPKGDLGSIMQYLRLHKQRLALWAVESFPKHIKVMPAKRMRRRKLVLDLKAIQRSHDPPTLGQIALGCLVLDVVESNKGNRNFIYLGHRQICCTCSGFSRRSVQCEHVTTWKESHSDWRNCFRAKQPSDVSTNLS